MTVSTEFLIGIIASSIMFGALTAAMLCYMHFFRTTHNAIRKYEILLESAQAASDRLMEMITATDNTLGENTKIVGIVRNILDATRNGRPQIKEKKFNGRKDNRPVYRAYLAKENDNKTNEIEN